MAHIQKVLTLVALTIIALGYVSYRLLCPLRTLTEQDAPTGAVENWPDLAQKFESENVSVAAILEHSTKVETFRVSARNSEFITAAELLKSQKSKQQVSGFPVTAIGPVLKPDFSRRLAEVLLNPKSYLAPGEDGKACILTPGVAVRVWKDKQFADVLICFACDQLLVVEQDPTVPLRSIGAHRARFRVGGDFDPVRPQLVKLCKAVFVKDPEIQALALTAK